MSIDRRRFVKLWNFSDRKAVSDIPLATYLKLETVLVMERTRHKAKDKKISTHSSHNKRAITQEERNKSIEQKIMIRSAI